MTRDEQLIYEGYKDILKKALPGALGIAVGAGAVGTYHGIKNKSKSIKLINIYVPNGNPVGTEKYEYKKDWYNSFIKRVKETLIQDLCISD